MTTAELLEQIRDVLSTDTVLLAWCQSVFGKDPLICIDVDENNPPNPETDYPVIVISDIRQTRGDARREISWELELGVGLVQDEIVESGNTRTLTGFLQAETLRELAENALYRARIADLGSRGESGTISIYPLFISGSVIPINTLKSNRRGLPG